MQKKETATPWTDLVQEDPKLHMVALAETTFLAMKYHIQVEEYLEAETIDAMHVLFMALAEMKRA